MDWWRDEGPESGESEVSMVELGLRLLTVRLGLGEEQAGTETVYSETWSW